MLAFEAVLYFSKPISPSKLRRPSGAEDVSLRANSQRWAGSLNAYETTQQLDFSPGSGWTGFPAGKPSIAGVGRKETPLECLAEPKRLASLVWLRRIFECNSLPRIAYVTR
jgi:hypothetical protein